MGWSPSNTTLGTVDEGDTFSFTITYTNDTTGLEEGVVVTQNAPVDSVQVTGLGQVDPKILEYYNVDFSSLDNFSINSESVWGYSLTKANNSNLFFADLNETIQPPFTIEMTIREKTATDYVAGWNAYLYNDSNYGRIGTARFGGSFVFSGARWGINNVETGSIVNVDWVYYNEIVVLAVQVDENWNWSYHESLSGFSRGIRRRLTGTVEPEYRTSYNKIAIGTLPISTLTNYNNDIEEKYYSIRVSNALKYPTDGSNKIIDSLILGVESDTVNLIRFADLPPINTITGNYSDVFDQTIKYRTKQDTFVEVQKWNEINTQELYGVYHFIQDTATTRTYTFEATAGSASQTYSIIVNNDIDYDKRQLARYVNPTGLIVTWTNAAGDTVEWINNNNDTVVWET